MALKDRNVWSHSSGGKKDKIRMSVMLVLSKGSEGPPIHCPSPRLCCRQSLVFLACRSITPISASACTQPSLPSVPLCVLIWPSYKDGSHSRAPLIQHGLLYITCAAILFLNKATFMGSRIKMSTYLFKETQFNPMHVHSIPLHLSQLHLRTNDLLFKRPSASPP